MPRTILGLDLGPSSIGWALIEEVGDEEGRIIDLGVRVFPEGVDKFDTGKEESRNKQRRDARMMRRQISRRSRRKRKLRDAVIAVRLFPGSSADAERYLRSHPCYESLIPAKVHDWWPLFFSLLESYELRTKALDEKLEPYELGRVLLHLNQRRGFKSNK